MLTVAEAASILNLSEGRTRALIKSGALLAEKKGRQWLIFERSVENRLVVEAKPGRPFKSRAPITEEKEEFSESQIEEAYSLYKECKRVLCHGTNPLLFMQAKSEEERAFYVHVGNFFLACDVDMLAKQGVY